MATSLNSTSSQLELPQGDSQSTSLTGMKPILTALSDDDASAASVLVRPVETASHTEPSRSPSIGSKRRRSTPDIICSYLWFVGITLPILFLDLLRLMLFALALSPAFARMVWFYFGTAHRTSVRYGTESVRQTLDVYTSSNSTRRRSAATSNPPNNEQKTILFFCCGGAWTIGYKMWGALLARVMVRTGMEIIVPDYRNYPGGTVADAVRDVQCALEWVQQHYSSDCQIVLVGQSAGGHLLMTMLLRQALQRQQPSVQGMIALAAPLQLDLLPATFRKHGMRQETIMNMFEDQIADYDPYDLLRRLQEEHITSDATPAHELLPPIALYHGTWDRTVPIAGSLAFLERFQQARNSRISFETYEGWSHTDPILEGPAAADHRFHLDIFRRMVEWTTTDGLAWPSNEQDQAILRRMCPQAMVAVARWCVPF